MPRFDLFASLHPGLEPYSTRGVTSDAESEVDPFLHSYRSGFWGFAWLAPRPSQDSLAIGVAAKLEGGGELISRLGIVEIVDDGLTSPADTRAPEIAICMATYNPPPVFLERQIDSIRAQSHRDWVCYISDDCSSPSAFEALERIVGDDERFVVSRSRRRVGFYLNFERALAMAPQASPYIALADQDDSWHPDKLATLLGQLGEAKLIYSDARIVSRDGAVISDTYWTQRRNNHTSMLSLLVANSVTGAASLMRREVLDLAVPFPPAQFAHYHDHWLGLVALALGEIGFVKRPLYDYLQHDQASLGHATANKMTPLSRRLRSRLPPRERVRAWRLHYFVDACRVMQLATTLLARMGSEIPRHRRRALERFLAAESSPLAAAHLAAKGALELMGRSETLGAEWMLFHAFAWRQLLNLTLRARPQRRGRLDAVPPPTLRLGPARRELSGSAGALVQKIEPLDLVRSEDAPARLNVLIPTVDLRHFFGGYIAKFNLALRLAQRGHRVRIVTVDPLEPLSRDWKRSVESFAGLDGLFDRVEIAFGRGAQLEASPSDSFVATTWWTAHIAGSALESLGGERFAYLIQEYEPFTFPMGSYAALASDSYRKPHFAIFSSEMLRGYFRSHRIGVYEGSVAQGDSNSIAFENAITAVEPPSAQELMARKSRRLLFYARPEDHAARNMFEVGMLALSRAIADGALASDWELHGVGTVERAQRLPLSGSRELNLLPRTAQSSYGELLREHDVGLALMYTPHPSLVPLEMAAAGMVTVTNTFENKTATSLTAISPNLIPAEPTIDEIALALGRAVARAERAEDRVQGSEVRWSRDWQRSFSEEMLAELERGLGLQKS